MLFRINYLFAAFVVCLSVFAKADQEEEVEVDETPRNAICINQDDFSSGTLIIDKPGVYALCEDIVFDPNAPPSGSLPSDDAYDPDFSIYDKNAFGLGFFAAICIASSDVTLYLNGKTLEQSEGHALFQRFYANIELADSPFIKGAGPAQFVSGSSLQPASNVKILGPGTIGRSSHHGIHGNDNKDIKVKNVVFRDFEVAAVSLNNVDGLAVSRCRVLRNRHDVPVLGAFSAARFIRQYGKKLVEVGYKMDLRGVETKAADLYDALIESINNVYSDVVLGNGRIKRNRHPEEYKLFNNPFRVVDGPCYAFVVHGKGPAVGGQGEVFNDGNAAITSSEVSIKGNIIRNVKCWVNEVPALVDGGAVINDARGAIFQTVNSVDGTLLSMNEDNTYKGNVVADMQMMVAQAIRDGTLTDAPELQTGVNTISQNLIDWAKSGTQPYVPKYRCNGDAMHHVSKGMIMIRVENTAGFSISRNIITNIENLSVAPFNNCFDYHAGASSENFEEQQACNTRVISTAADRGFADGSQSKINRNIVRNVRASQVANNPAVQHWVLGIDVQGDSKGIVVKGNFVNLSSGVGDDESDEFCALRLRENVDQTVVVKNNNRFKQDILVLNSRRLRSRKMVAGHPGGEIEWKAEGCPFAHTMGKKRIDV